MNLKLGIIVHFNVLFHDVVLVFFVIKRGDPIVNVVGNGKSKEMPRIVMSVLISREEVDKRVVFYYVEIRGSCKQVVIFN